MDDSLEMPLIERNEQLEQKFGIALEGLFAYLRPTHDVDAREVHLVVNGEARTTGGSKLPRDLQIIASAHNADGAVIGTWRTSIEMSGFEDIQAFSIAEYAGMPAHLVIARVKVYPQGA